MSLSLSHRYVTWHRRNFLAISFDVCRHKGEIHHQKDTVDLAPCKILPYLYLWPKVGFQSKVKMTKKVCGSGVEPQTFRIHKSFFSIKLLLDNSWTTCSHGKTFSSHFKPFSHVLFLLEWHTLMHHCKDGKMASVFRFVRCFQPTLVAKPVRRTLISLKFSPNVLVILPRKFPGKRVLHTFPYEPSLHQW